ncbi:MAG: hypothetical protein RIB59_04715 [Rhodospirillales bacterium]
MRQRLFYLAYAGFNALLIAAAFAFALYASGGAWIVKERGGIHQQERGQNTKPGGEQRRLRRGWQ